MSHQGGSPSGTGYGRGYDPPIPYQPLGYQQQYLPNNHPQPSWDSPTQEMSAPQIQQTSHMQQMQEAVYYQSQQYAPAPNVPSSNAYYQVPVQPVQPIHHYSQYANQQQQQHIPQYEHPTPQQFHASDQQLQPQQMASTRHQPPQLQHPPASVPKNRVQISHRQNPPKSAPKSQSRSLPGSQPLDQQMLLIALAEEYFTAAHNLGPSVARVMTEDLVKEYQCLIATGLGCLEASLRKTRLAPRLEAKVRLRYASVLFEETENYMEAETVLSQGIILCDQNRYLDLKYSMQVLLAQLVFIKNPRASVKSLERHCADSKAYQHHSWEYVFRFLRASLSLRSNKVSDTQAALHDLRYVSSLANDRADRAIFLLSSLMEVLAHLSSPTSESAEQVQTALAAAWTYQLDTDSRIPQLLVLTHLLDVTCSMLYGLPAQTVPKQKAMDEALKSFEWSTSSDVISIPINATQGQTQLVSQDTGGILGTSGDGKDMLKISFLNNNDAFALTFLLSGIALLHNNCMDGKAWQYLRQGLLSLLDSTKSRKGVGSLPGTIATLQWRAVLSCYFLAYSVFCLASSSDWKNARDHLEMLGDALKDLDETAKGPLTHLYTYLSGICFQGTGDLHSALRMFTDPILRLPEKCDPGTSPHEQVQLELCLLASLNALWIHQADPNHSAGQNTTMIARLAPLCANHPNKDIETAFNLVRATVPTDPPNSGVKTKTYLGSALEAAKSTSNKQFTCIILGVMCSSLFVGVVGIQAEKAGKAAVAQAKRARNPLWVSVTNGLLAQNLELQGKHEEAQAAQEEARRFAARAFPTPS